MGDTHGFAEEPFGRFALFFPNVGCGMGKKHAARPCDRGSGDPQIAPADRGQQRAQLACDWASPPEVEDWVPVSLAPALGGTPASAVAVPGRRGAGSVSRLAQADAWWRIPAGRGRFARGEYIDVQPMPGALL